MKIIFDIGGTNTRVAAVTTEKTFGPPRTYATPQNFYDGVLKLVAAAQECAGAKKITAFIGGVAGSFNPAHDTLITGKHIHDWVGKPLAEKICEALGYDAQIILENDAALGALGEACAGAGRGFKTVVFLTVGTGVGGARVVAGHLEPHTHDTEPGHQIFKINGVPQELEAAVSGSAFEKMYGMPPQDITDEQVWHEAARALAQGVCKGIDEWAPDVVVLGGSMITKPRAIPLGEIITETKKLFASQNKNEKNLPPIVRAELGDESVLYGALFYNFCA